MSLITWNPNDKDSTITLSQDNLYVDTGRTLGRFVRATKGVSSGKWYWEVTLKDNSIQAGCIGFITLDVTHDQDIRTNAKLRGYRPSNGNKSSTSNVNGVSYGETSTENDVIGVALDLDSGILEFYKNGVSLGVAFNDLNTLGELYPVMVNSSSIGNQLKGLANFGATEFHIVTSNPNVWQELVRQGYLPYDLENASWFRFYTTDPQIVKTTAASQINTQGYKGINQITVVDNITEEDKYTEQLNMTLQTQLEQGNIFTVTVDKTIYRKIFDLFVV